MPLALLAGFVLFTLSSEREARSFAGENGSGALRPAGHGLTVSRELASSATFIADGSKGSWIFVDARLDEGSTYYIKNDPCLETKIGMASSRSMTHSIAGKGCSWAPSNSYSTYGFQWTDPGSPLIPDRVVQMTLRATIEFDKANPNEGLGIGSISVRAARQDKTGRAVPQEIGVLTIGGTKKGEWRLPTAAEKTIEWKVPGGDKDYRFQIQFVGSGPQTQQTFNMWYEWREDISGPVPVPSSPAAVASLLKQASDYYDQGKYAEAIQAFDKVIEANPKSAEAYARRGSAKRGNNDLEGALADANRAIQLDPNCAEAYRCRSMVKRARNDFQGALADADRAVDLFSRANPLAYLTRGHARAALKDTQGALADYSRAVELNPNNASAFFYRGLARLNTKDNAGALEDFNRYVGMDPKDSNGFNNRGIAKERLGDTAGAIADYKQAVALDPNNAQAKANAANLSGVREVEIFNSNNSSTVRNEPTVAATFVLSRPHRITMIWTYHWNGGQGTNTGTGTIALRDANGRTFGPWQAKGTPGQGGVPNAYWTCSPNVEIPAGIYTILDSESKTWSQNSESGGRGMAVVKGRAL